MESNFTRNRKQLVLTSVSVLISILIIANISVSGLEYTQIEANLIGGFIVDLAWDDKDRLVRVWTNMTNYEISDEYFTMSLINPENKTVVQNNIEVFSTNQNGIVNFGSMVVYMVNELDICAYELGEDATQCSNVIIGNYEIQIATKDRSVVDSETFTIIDTRNV